MAVYPLIVNATAQQTVANVSTIDGKIAGNPIAIFPGNPAGSNSPANSCGFQVVVTGSGNVSASIQPVASNDGIHWTALGSPIAASSVANVSSAIGFSSNAPYAHLGAYVSAISGTGATVNANVCA